LEEKKMKSKIIAALTVVFALCLALTVLALNKTNVSPKRGGADCCAKKDSCPMKKGDNQSAEKHSCCDMDDCCCKGDSCPMKMSGEKSEGKDCCCKGGSCPMKKSEDKQTNASGETNNVTVAADGESCDKGKHS
jgi:hypothetical protein